MEKKIQILFLGILCLFVLNVITVLANSDEDDDGVEKTFGIASNLNKKDKTIEYQSPTIEPGKFYFADHFDELQKFSQKWIKSQAKKDDTADEIAKYDGVWSVETPTRPLLKNDFGLVLKSKAKHAAIASRLLKPFVFVDKTFIVQYEVTLQDGQECGGAYIKLLSSGKETTDLGQFHDRTPYTIMFGPDKCGNDIKLHFIFRHVNPINGTITEKHCRKAKDRLEEPFKDKQPHLYQLIIRPDNTYEIKFDHRIINEGSLFTEFTPPVNPPKEIDDPEDFKPSNWDEREKIPDPDSKKPDDWDEDAPPQIPDPSASKPEGWLDDVEEMLPDPSAEKPEDWDTDMDGEWEAPLITNPVCEKAVGCGLWKAPMIKNPEYKGKWRAPLIDNPNYQGKWAPRKISNPDYFEDKNPYGMTTISAIGIELWSMSSDILFDNLIITDDETAARDWAAQTFDLKRKIIDKEAETFVSRIVKFTNDNPWMWAVYIVVIGLPISISLYFACSPKKDKPTNAKKVDAYQPDDEDLVKENVKQQRVGKSDLNTPTTQAPPNPDLAENKENDDDDEVDYNEDEDDDDEQEPELIPADDDEDDGQPQIAEIEEIEAAEPVQETGGVKKRRPRKD
uniref:Putative calnexin n=1 Tax=Corethrella appendiculata TaxID=1370023 RepID=U5EYL6_9DIPT